MMADRTISIDIFANDYATAVFRNVGHGISSFAGIAYSGIESANKALRRYNSSMQGFNSIVTSVFRTAGKAVYDFTTDSIKQFAELEKQHAKTMGVLSATYDFNWNGNNTAEQAKNMEQFFKDSTALKEQAYKMGSVGPTGKGSLYSPDEISAAQLSLARAGITSDQMLNTDIVETVIKFAGGNDISVDSAVAFGVQLGAQFDKKPEEWSTMFDQVTNAANMAPIDVNDVMASLKYVGNMAAGYDVPLSDVLSAIVIMGQSGLKGSQAGSGISAIFSRGMNPTGITTASKAPTANVENVYNSFKDKVIDDKGNFIGLEGFTDELQVVMDGLTDVELAWFNKKMFGMYQQKAALALGRTSEDTDKTFGDIANAIAENSEGVNDALYNLILESSGGQIEALENVWSTTKMRFGDAISPLTKEVTKQLISGLSTNNMTIDRDGLQAALDEAVNNVNDQFGGQIAKWVNDIGSLGINGSQIVTALAPGVATGTMDAVEKFISGDVLGTFSALNDIVKLTDDSISELPPELQDTARKLRNLIIWIEKIYAFNIVAKLAELITSIGLLIGGVGGFIYNLIRGKTSASVNTTVASANAVINTTNAVINANYAQINAGQIGSATFGIIQSVASFIATTTTMTVTASSVIVNGGVVNSVGNAIANGMAQGAGFSLGAGGTMVGGGMLLGGGAMVGGGMLGSGMAPGMLGGGSLATGGALLSGGSQIIDAEFTVIEETGGAAGAGAGAGTGAAGAGAGTASSALATAGRALGIVGNLAMLMSLSGSTANDKKQYADYYNEGVNKGLSGSDLKSYVMQRAYDTGYHNLPDNEVNIYKDSSRESAAGKWYDNTMTQLAALYSTEGLETLYEELVNQVTYGKIDENFLHGLSTMMSDKYNANIQIDQNMLTTILKTLFNDDFKPGGYMGSFADSKVDKFVRENIGNENTEWRGYGTFNQVFAALNGILNGYEYIQNSDNLYRNTATGATYQLTEDGKLVALNEAASQMSNAANNFIIAANDMSMSARDMATKMITSGAVNVLDLHQGPLSQQGAIDYLTNKMTGNAGKHDYLNVPDPFSILSGNSIMNRFSSSMTGNTESSGTAYTNEILTDIESEVGQIIESAANSITDEGMRAAFLEGFSNYESIMGGSVAGLQTSVISLNEAVSMLSKDQSWVNGLGQGPMSSDGAYSYVMEQLASGTAANQQLLQNIQNGISALDPTLTVDITNRQPIVNVDVKVNVDKSGNVTKHVLTGALSSTLDNLLYRSSKRYGTTTRIER